MEFKIKTYGRTELALTYCPGMTPASAYRKFSSWIVRYPHLKERLEELGHNRHCRTYTPAQVQVIIDALGEP